VREVPAIGPGHGVLPEKEQCVKRAVQVVGRGDGAAAQEARPARKVLDVDAPGTVAVPDPDLGSRFGRLDPGHAGTEFGRHQAAGLRVARSVRPGLVPAGHAAHAFQVGKDIDLHG